MVYTNKVNQSLEDVIIHIMIEEQNKTRDKAERAKELYTKENMVEEILRPNFNRLKRQNPRTKPAAPLPPSHHGGARGKGARLDWDSLPAFSNVGGPKSYN